MSQEPKDKRPTTPSLSASPAPIELAPIELPSTELSAAGPPSPCQEPASCRPSLEDLYRYMDGHLEPQQREAVRRQVDNCGYCQSLLHHQTGFQRLLGERCKTELPQGLSSRIFKSIYDQG